MLFKTAIVSTVALFLASKALGAAIDSPVEDVEARAALIATDPYYACNCPNNCSHKSGSSCKYYSGPSDSSPVISGHCYGSPLYCIAS